MTNSTFNFAALSTLIILAVYILYPSSPSAHEFELFKTKFGRVYHSEVEEQYRREIFNLNIDRINAHNKDKTQTYTQGVNQFTDKTQQELENLYLTLNNQIKHIQIQTIEQFYPILADVDWEVLKKVTPVKDQGSRCGSSWAFSAIGAVESALMISNITNQTLSVQQLVDCTEPYGNYGCNGGLMNVSFQYIIEKGITTEAAYPYAGISQDCKIDGGAFKISKHVDFSSCTKLMNELSSGPVSVAPDASNWFTYQGGILSNCGKSPNHGALVVGFSKDYWRVKNSWGIWWGENGYIRLAPGNTCHLCDISSRPIV